MEDSMVYYPTVLNERFFITVAGCIIIALLMGFMHRVLLWDGAKLVKPYKMRRFLGAMTVGVAVFQYFMVGMLGVISGFIICVAFIYIYACAMEGQFVRLDDDFFKDPDEKDDE